jgi:hypothetical protein
LAASFNFAVALFENENVLDLLFHCWNTHRVGMAHLRKSGETIPLVGSRTMMGPRKCGTDMCEKCAELDKKIERCERAVVSVGDRVTVERLMAMAGVALRPPPLEAIAPVHLRARSNKWLRLGIVPPPSGDTISLGRFPAKVASTQLCRPVRNAIPGGAFSLVANV